MVCSAVEDGHTEAQSILGAIGRDLQGQEDWRACGSEQYDCLQRILFCLQSSSIAEKILFDQLDQVLHAAKQAITSVHHSKVQRKWRRLYTDIHMLKGLAVFLGKVQCVGWSSANKQDAIQGLDMAIIVAGAPGLDRLDMVQRIIRLLQLTLSEIPSISTAHKTNDDDDIEFNKATPLCLASQPVLELPSLPSLGRYLNDFSGKPFIVRGYAIDWPAIQDKDRRWADANYLIRVAGPNRVVPVEIGGQYTDDDWSQDIVPWDKLIQTIGWTKDPSNMPESKEDEKMQYLAQHNLFNQFPPLMADIVLPDLVYSCPPAPPHFPTYQAPIDEEGVETTITNAWLGPRGTTTPAHFDPYYNAYVQIVGYKLVWIAPPNIFAKEDPNILNDTNSSTIAVFEERSAGTEQGSRIKAGSMTTVLGPGDLLILPPAWFHALRSLTRSFSVSMWY